ncbi:hypothetical protein GCM10022251_38690 [Phytohabitans flavus]|uniref:Uncharacterized protein n=1 Tax=Phytohabitans flavus TaxID=1076124 RepID=A0A6F8XVF1_9ACTN|nr:hypothetical protein Pflav_042160 [Phytohabitans flavus]
MLRSPVAATTTKTHIRAASPHRRVMAKATAAALGLAIRYSQAVDVANQVTGEMTPNHGNTSR